MSPSTERGRIEQLVKILHDLQPTNTELARIATNEAKHFARNRERVGYPTFRA
jgi:hypothetical protein